MKIIGGFESFFGYSDHMTDEQIIECLDALIKRNPEPTRQKTIEGVLEMYAVSNKEIAVRLLAACYEALLRCQDVNKAHNLTRYLVLLKLAWTFDRS